MTQNIDEILLRLDEAEEGVSKGEEAAPAFREYLKSLKEVASDLKEVSGSIESVKRIILEPVASEVKKSTSIGISLSLLGVVLGAALSYFLSRFFPVTPPPPPPVPAVKCEQLPRIEASEDISTLLRNLNAGVLYLERECMGVTGEKIPNPSETRLEPGNSREIVKGNGKTISLSLYDVGEQDGVRYARFKILSDGKLISSLGIPDVVRVLDSKGIEGLSGETILVNEGNAFVVGEKTKVTVTKVMKEHTSIAKVADAQDAVTIAIE